MVQTYRTLANLLPGKFSARDIRGDNLSFRVESHNFHPDRAGSTALDFVLMSKEVDSRFTSTVIEGSFDEDA